GVQVLEASLLPAAHEALAFGAIKRVPDPRRAGGPLKWLNPPKALAADCVPDRDRAVVPPDREPLAVRADRDVNEPAALRDGERFAAGGNVPHLHLAGDPLLVLVHTAGGTADDSLPVEAEGDRVHVAGVFLEQGVLAALADVLLAESLQEGVLPAALPRVALAQGCQ